MKTVSVIYQIIKSAYRKKRLDTRGSLVATYRYSIEKPERVGRSSFALFYRSKALWTLLQVIGFGALAFWTVRNYVHIIQHF
jgi:hypothetical protein